MFTCVTKNVNESTQQDGTDKSEFHTWGVESLMRTSNNKLWLTVDTLVDQYAEASDKEIKERLFEKIFILLKKYIGTCAGNAVRRASQFRLSIPKEDFISAFNLSLWETVKSFDSHKGRIKSLISYRFRIAEATVWRHYETRDVNEKDGRSYAKARWDSLDKSINDANGDSSASLIDFIITDHPSTEETYLADHELTELLQLFAAKNARYAKIINSLSQGYEGSDLAQVTHEGSNYDPKVRKLVQRAEDSFGKFRSNIG
ncbi:hypothetical protein SAMN02982927_01291 [Sporolactobacillus nakayamae]|uniref:Uncharacterized protein n=2 Tax=Sporolactobacillus nakayamae TaxID=269670 RepID=A0A1I2QMK2_9BACL|nr:hypothetical protein SAMN02982927_01291 [Sporolactobacillus nakayamae]